MNSAQAAAVSVAISCLLSTSQEVVGQCGQISMTQSNNPDTVQVGIGVACEEFGTDITFETSFARSFDLSACPTTGRYFALTCVTFAVEFNTVADYDVNVNVYEDIDGGVPDSSLNDLVLIGTTSVTIPVVDVLALNEDKFFTVDFTNGGSLDPLFISPDSRMVVEIHLPDRVTGDGGMIRLGFNDEGESENTFTKAIECGTEFYKTLPFLGFNFHHLLMTIEGDLAEAEAPCVGDCDAGGDGVVDVNDLLSLLAGWGQSGQSCDIANDDDNIDVDDLLVLLAAWGPCPPPIRPPLCVGDTDNNDVVDVNDLLLLLAEWGVVDCSLADFDFNNLVDVDDLLVLLAAWGACPN